MKEDRFDFWFNRAGKLLMFGFLPLTLTEKSNKEIIRIVGILFLIPWFVITLPIQLLLVFPALGCILMALTYLDDF